MTGWLGWLSATLLAVAVAVLVGPATPSARLRLIGGPPSPTGRRSALPRLATAVARRFGRVRGGAAEAEATADGVVGLVEALAAELRAGQPPPSALVAAAGGTTVLRPQVVVAAQLSGPVADLLDEAAAAPGAGGLHAVAACWRVAEQSGAGLAQGLERAARGLRDEQQVAREVAAQLAAPRATGLLLALLPLFGLLLGSALGADPVHVLLGTPVGWVCLALGLPLQIAGWWWVNRLAAAVDPWRR